MARTLSQDLRDRVIAAVNGGMSRHAAAERFGVALAIAIRWVRAWRTDGVPTPRPKGGDLHSQRIEKFRKTAHASEQERPDVAVLRQVWFDAQPDRDLAHLAFIDA